MSLVLAVDIGTSNIKAGVVNETGEILSIAEKELKIERPESGAAEHNPDKLYREFLNISRKVLIGFENKVSAMTLSAYQLGILPLDGNMEPLTGIMTLLDVRSQETAEFLKKKYDMKKLYSNTGCPAIFQYPLFKIFWLREKRKEIFRKARFYMSSKDYIIYRLLGKPFSEFSIASATQLFNINSFRWDEYAMGIAGIDENKLPQLIPGDKILSRLPFETQKSLGLKNEVYLVPGVYDGGGSALGTAGLLDGVGAINVGTTAMLRVSCTKPILDRSGLMRFYPYYLCHGKWFVGAGINNAGLSLRWFRDNILSSDYSHLVSLAEKARPGSDNLFFLPFFTGERDPRIGSFASAVLFGLKELHTKNHIVRSFLEGVVYSLRLIKEALQDNDVKIKEIRIGGSGSKSDLWQQIFADILKIPIRRAKSEQAGLIGESMLAYIALGKYKSIEEATCKMVKLENSVSPIQKNMKIYDKGFKFFSFLLKEMGNIYPAHYSLAKPDSN